MRERLVETLSEYALEAFFDYMKRTFRHFCVDFAGKCSKDGSIRSVCPVGDSCEKVFRRYYFHIEAENADCKE